MVVSTAFLITVVAIVALSLLGLPVGHAMIGGSVLYLLMRGMDLGTAAEQLLKEATEGLEKLGLTFEAGESRVYLSRCYWELDRPEDRVPDHSPPTARWVTA